MCVDSGEDSKAARAAARDINERKVVLCLQAIGSCYCGSSCSPFTVFFGGYLGIGSCFYSKRRGSMEE